MRSDANHKIPTTFLITTQGEVFADDNQVSKLQERPRLGLSKKEVYVFAGFFVHALSVCCVAGAACTASCGGNSTVRRPLLAFRSL